MTKTYDVAIIGAGITGTSILYALSTYTNITSITLIEKYLKPAQVNTAHWNNSQTLHFGDIETNYTYDKAKKVKEASDMVKTYLQHHDRQGTMHTKTKKMVLAIGHEQVKELEQRHHEFITLFPNLTKLDKKGIERVEPNVVQGRNINEPILALCSDDGYAVDFGKLSTSFIEEAKKTGKTIDLFFGQETTSMKREKEAYVITTPSHTIRAKIVMVAAGSHSLMFAQWFNYAKDTILLPVAGSFYTGNNMLNNKIYTMQIKKLPFAAIHGDPDVTDHTQTRFGPTAKVLPILERRNISSFIDFLKLFQLRLDAIIALIHIIKDPTLFKYILKNFVFDMPFIGKCMFLKEVRKIVPSARLKDITFAKGYGGIRPQVVNVKEKRLDMGEAQLLGHNIIFNITPSPGASVCLKNAENDAKTIIAMLGKSYTFNQKEFDKKYKKTTP